MVDYNEFFMCTKIAAFRCVVVALALLNLIIRQFIEYLTFDSLSCQMYLLSSVAFLYLLNLNELVWQ